MSVEEPSRENSKIALGAFGFLFSVGVVLALVAGRGLGRLESFYEGIDDAALPLLGRYGAEHGWWILLVLAVASLASLIAVAGYAFGKHNAKKAVVAAWVVLSLFLLFAILGLAVTLGSTYNLVG